MEQSNDGYIIHSNQSRTMLTAAANENRNCDDDSNNSSSSSNGAVGADAVLNSRSGGDEQVADDHAPPPPPVPCSSRDVNQYDNVEEWSPDKDLLMRDYLQQPDKQVFRSFLQQSNEQDGLDDNYDADNMSVSENESTELTDYENDNIVQYQAAIDAGLVDEERQCWVCFASDEDDPTASWVHPCRCSGTTKWVHTVCIHRWVEEKQKDNNAVGVACPQCGTDYTIWFPPSSMFMKVLDTLDMMVGHMYPWVTGGIMVGGIYWSLVTFGAVTIIQVVGHDEGWQLIEAADPVVLLVSLPLVPIGLYLSRMIRWQEPVIKVLRLYLPRFTLTKYILPAFAFVPEREGSGAAASIPPSSDRVSVMRILCGTIFFPTIATFLGSTLFSETASPLKRAALGGLTFVVVKGVLKVYHKQHLYIRQSRRIILDYPDR